MSRGRKGENKRRTAGKTRQSDDEKRGEERL